MSLDASYHLKINNNFGDCTFPLAPHTIDIIGLLKANTTGLD